MRVLIDADGCPVVDIVLKILSGTEIKCFILCDTAHEFNRPGAETIVVSKGADSVDYALVNMLSPGDIAITQDYGLAAMCLAKKARAISQNGMEYTEDNIDSLLSERHYSKKARMAGVRTGTMKKRTEQQNEDFARAFKKIITE